MREERKKEGVKKKTREEKKRIRYKQCIYEALNKTKRKGKRKE